MEYRRSLAASFLYRFFVDIALQLEAGGSSYKAADWLPPGHESAAVHFERPASQGVQYFNKVGEQDVVGAPVRHMAADLQACPCPLLCWMLSRCCCFWHPVCCLVEAFCPLEGASQHCVDKLSLLQRKVSSMHIGL